MAAACTATTPETTGQTRQAIINGTDSPSPAQDAIVRIEVDVPGGAGICTGTLIAPNLVLTARHCVSEGKDGGFSCDQNGPAPGDEANSAPGNDYQANQMKIYTGNTAPADDATPRARGTKIIHDETTTLCNHDVSLIILDTAINDIPPLKVRTDSPPAVGEVLTSVGWGLTQDNATPPTRKERTGVAILRIGPGDSLPSNEFEVGESICSGDSGGPALSADNQVVGVVSRGGNNQPDDPNNLAKGCIGAGTTNDYEMMTGFKALVDGAMSEAAGTPATPSDAGASSSSSSGAAAPADEKDSGCATSPRSSSPAGALLFAAAVAFVLGKKKRR